MESKKNSLDGRQWTMLILESLGWSGVMVMGYFFTSYYALIQNVFSYTDMEIADLAALMSLVGAFAYLFGGFIADIVKPTICLTVTYVGLLACGVLIFLRPDYPVMQMVAVLVSVFGLGTFVSPMLKFVATLGTREQSPTLYGYFYMLAAAESLIIAPIASKVINSSSAGAGLNVIVAFFCGMMVLSWIGHILYVQPQQKKLAVDQPQVKDDSGFSFKLVGELLKNPNMWFVMAIGVFTVLPYDLNTFVQPLLASEFDAPQSTIQFVASYANNGTALILAPLAGIIAAKIGSTTKTIAMSLVMAVIASLGILFLPWDAKYLAIAVVSVFMLRGVFSIGKPARNTMVGESRLPKRARGTVIGLLFFVTGLQSTFIAKGAGILTTNFGTNTGYHILYSIGLAMFVIGLVVTMLFAKRLEKAKKQDEANGHTPEDLMI